MLLDLKQHRGGGGGFGRLTISVMSLSQYGHCNVGCASRYHSSWQLWQKTTSRSGLASSRPGRGEEDMAACLLALAFC